MGFLLIGGVWADRLPRHHVMVATDLIRFALHALLATLIFTGTVEIWQIALIEAGFGTAEAFFRPAYTGLVPQTVPEEQIQPAKATFGTRRDRLRVRRAGTGDRARARGRPRLRVRDRRRHLPRLGGVPAAAAPARARGRRGAHDGANELSEGWAEVRSRTWVWAIILFFSLALLTRSARG